MNRKILFPFFLLCFFFLSNTNNVIAQLSAAETDAVKVFEGFPPMPFEAPDMQKNKHFLPDYKGKTVVLYFWDTQGKDCLGQLNALDKISKEFSKDNVVVLGMADDEKAVVEAFLASKKYNFPMIANVLELANFAYGGEKMDGSRVFIINKSGIIQKVLLHPGGESTTYKAVREQIVINEG